MQKRLTQFGLIVGGTLFGCVIALLLITLVFGDVRLLLARAIGNETVFTVGMGDILYWQYEDVRPPENPDIILSAHGLRFDPDGFRLPVQSFETYPIVALGDSFTEAANVAITWPDALAATGEIGVRNLGFKGYGPQHYAWVMENYGVQYDPEIVIVTFFGGNDLASAGLQGFDEPIMLPAEQRANEVFQEPEPVPQPQDDIYRYPVQTIDGEPLVLLDDYLSWSNVDAETLLQSVNYEVIENSLRRIQAVAPDACLIFAYFPAKAEVYLPYVRPEDRATVIETTQHILIDSEGRLNPITVPDLEITYEKLLSIRRTTAQVLSDLADDVGFHFADTWPVLDQAVAAGKHLYYTYDTHWNQAGQQRVGEYLAEVVTNQCP